MTRPEFFALPVLSSHFPLVYANKARWTSMSGECSSCQKKFPDERLRGHVTQPFPRIFIIDALGFCESCDILSPIRYRVYDDMSMTGLSTAGEWSRWAARYSWWIRFKIWLRKLWARV